ncbi:uncharacterized protein LOC110463964 [Mizuhopecten yessoensis]|uniref:Small vasohibin-binding protein n=1 Tax=Mizuhopecten yessoensis TaxID=6573 RepID=A0A210PV08_MIZYE|nr:uncharacterized protein LOC110463964 [Mizuhopecten yessoensis]OWF40296.1 Coiled-coil domain-containing protein 23 [Mizuhopecten yessoensis]
MTAQSVLTKGIFHDFTYLKNVSASPGNDSDAVGSALGGRVPMYMDGNAPAVIRLTHTSPNSKPTSAYSTISGRNRLFDLNETIVVQESHHNGTITGHHPEYKAAQSHSQSFIYPDKSPTRNGTFTVKQSLSQIQDSRALDVADIHSLLTSDANRRPSSRQCVFRENAYKENKQTDHELTDLARCKTSTSTRSNIGLIEETDNHACPSGNSDEDNGDEDNGDKMEEKDEVGDTLPLTGNPYMQQPDLVHSVPNKSSTKKGKKNKKRSKSSLSTKMKTKLQASNRLYQQSKIKIPPATKVKSEKETSNKASVGELSNLTSVLQTQCKPITLMKHEQVIASSQKHSHRSGAMSEILRPKVVHIDALKPFSKSSGGSRGGGIDSPSSQNKLPQMTMNSLVQQNSSQEPGIQMSPGSDLLNTSKSYLHNENRVTYYQTSANEIAKVTKVYLSEKHSGTMKDCGMEYPCAPPATPTPDQLKKVEYVPSMNDIRAQRAVKLKLQVLEKEASKKTERQKEEKARQEKLQMKDREKELKIRQRNEIYALNKAMTELEQQRFQEFCSKRGIVL